MSRRRGFLILATFLCVVAITGCELFLNRDPVAAFVVTYGVDPADPMVVELDATVSSDPDGDPITAYLWTFGDDVTILTPLEYSKLVQTPVIRTRYPHEGTYTVSLLVRDDHGNDSVPITGTVTLPNVPVAPTD